MTAMDPIVLELINSKLTSIVDEMRVVLFHSGYSSILRESEDGTVGLLDAQLRTAATSKKLPLHFGSFSAIAEHLPKYYDPKGLEEGDVILFNNPYEGAVTHLHDTITLMPVFTQGHLIAYTGSLAHKSDLGGARNWRFARDLWEEALVIPPVKLYVRGEVNREVERIVAANSRNPVEILGDLRGQVAACRVGARRVTELCARFGVVTVIKTMEELMARVAKRLREELKAFPNGMHEAEAMLGQDGVKLDRPLRLHVAVTKQDDDIVFDFSASDGQSQEGPNAVPALIKNACYFALMAMTDPSVPFNHGFVEVVRTRFKEGTVVCPRPGAPLATYATLAYLASDVVLRALGEFRPDKAVGSAGGGGGFGLGGTTSTGKQWSLHELLDTALGATSSSDGVSLIHGTLGVGQFRPGPIEIHETECPVRLTRFDVWADSGGPGKFRGGLGCIREYQVLEEATSLSSRGERRRSRGPAWGVLGGRAGRVGTTWVNGVEVSGRVNQITENTLKPGDIVTVATNAGGGYGDPFERDPKLVLDDVLDGYVTIQAARDSYGVVISEETLELDLAATAELRQTIS